MSESAHDEPNIDDDGSINASQDSLVITDRSDEVDSAMSTFFFEIDSENRKSVVASSVDGASSAMSEKSSYQASVVNLANTIVGSSMLALPFAFASCGAVLGVVFLFAFAAAAAFGLHLLAACALKVGLPATFRSVTASALPGEGWSLLVDGVVAFKCFGVATSYLVVIGDTLPLVAVSFLNHHDSSALEARQFWIMAGMCVAAPLCFAASLDKLKFTSTLSLVFVVFLTAVVALGSVAPGVIVDDNDDDDDDDDDKVHNRGSEGLVAAKFDSTTLSQLTVFIFGFTCHQNVFPITNDLRGVATGVGGQGGHTRQVDAVIGTAIMLALVVYLVVAVSGYATFGAAVQSDILSSYAPMPTVGRGGPGVALVAAARVMVACLVCFSYPLQCHPCRACLFTIAASVFPRHLETPQQRFCFHVGATSLILTLSFVVAMSVTSLGDVLSVVGATGSTTVSYILPGIAYAKLFPHPHKKRMFALALFGSGCVFMPLALVGVALRLSDPA